MADRKNRHALISYFEKVSKEHGISVNINRYTEQWTADSLLESYDVQTLKDMIEYLFQVNKNPTWTVYARSIDDLIKSKASRDADNAFRKEMRVKAKEWLNG